MVTGDLPVVVVGAGPVGLAAAAQLIERGIAPLVLEAGSEAGAAVARWRHVRLFSRWSELIDPAAARLLARAGWTPPDPRAHPTGQEWAGDYLRPLAAALGARVRPGARVVGVARRGRDRVADAGRDGEPLVVHVVTDAGEERVSARAVIDASGTWGSPNPLGADGLPAVGEAAAAGRIDYRVPDLDDPAVRTAFAGRRVAVAGSGHLALTAVVALAALVERQPDTRVVWLLRRGQVGTVFGGGDADQLPARGALGRRAAGAVAAGHVEVVTGFRTAAVEPAGNGLIVVAQDGRRIGPLARVIALTGFRPDLSWLSEVRLDLDPVLQAARALAPMIDPNVHSCGTVAPHGARELTQPEPGLYVVGMKSYGRAPTFLALTGYEQVRSVAAALAGDHDAAGRVELVLPETGVCGGAGIDDESGVAAEGGCCGSSAAGGSGAAGTPAGAGGPVRH